MSTLPKPVHNSALLSIASADLGTEEWPGARHNPIVMAYFEASGHGWVEDDETPWCAAFVNAKLAELGLPGTNSLRARSFEDYGVKVPMTEVLPGDIAVFWRKGRNSAFGHVAIVHSLEKGVLYVLGGNQGNKVSVRPYSFDRLLSFRRVTGIAEFTPEGRPTLRNGDRGNYVLDLQTQLESLRFFSGAKDGMFGPATQASVVSFQSSAGLVADGIVGAKTWDALKSASPQPLRDITLPELRKDGSRTIEAADKGQTLAGAGAALAAGSGVLGSLTEASQSLTRAETALDIAQRLLMTYWPILVALLAAGAAWYFFDQIKQRRLEDAQTRKNMGR